MADSGLQWDPSQDEEPWSGKCGEINSLLPMGEAAIEDQRRFLPRIVSSIIEDASSRDFYGKVKKGVYSLKNYLELKNSVPCDARVALVWSTHAAPIKTS